MRFETTATSWEEGSTHQLLLVNCVTVMCLAAAELEPVADQIILLLLYSVCYHKYFIYSVMCTGTCVCCKVSLFLYDCGVDCLT